MQLEIPLLKVLLIDDEPFIRKGLITLIDWETEGYHIEGEASNGYDAIQLIKQNKYDLIISDIKMPEMDGIELITHVREHKISEAKFVFLSGYYDFKYAKTAINHGCCDYLLKPIQKEELLTTIRKIMDEYQKDIGKEKKDRDYKKAYLDRNLLAIIYGKYDSVNLNCVQEKMRLSIPLTYIHCEVSLNDEKFLELQEDKRREQQRKLYNYANLLLKNYADRIIYDTAKQTDCYEIGIIFCKDMIQDEKMSPEEWLRWLLNELSERVGYKIVACKGSEVNGLHGLAESYREAIMLRSFRVYKKYDNLCSSGFKKFTESKGIKEEEFKAQLEELIHVIEINDKFKIKEYAKSLYMKLMDQSNNHETIDRYIQYLLYRLIGLSYKQEVDINQEEIMQYIRESVFGSESNNGNGLKFHQFVEEYSNYLWQIRQNSTTGTMNLIEAHIKENYAENLSLKALGEKYCVNSVYLGQLFKKQYGCSFKDYLNNVRIRKAAEMLLHTDKKVYEVAFDTGYKDQEYFVIRFEEIYGATPTRFRKRSLQSQENIS
jgi:two-component system response regulator YesN